MKQLVILSLALLAGVSTAFGQYSIDWYTMDGGGGTSTGGPYSISGTIGQPDAGTLSGGAFVMQGGFWSLDAIASVPPPILSISLTLTNSVILSWPASSSNWQLLENTSPGTTHWTLVGTPPQRVGERMLLTIHPLSNARFYRLLAQ
jgi:hypothetical protein